MDPLSSRQQLQFDYRNALQRVQGLVQQLQERGAVASAASASAAAPDAASAQAAGALRFWRTNWRSVLAVMTLYSIPTAAVTALMFAERQKQVGLALRVWLSFAGGWLLDGC